MHQSKMDKFFSLLLFTELLCSGKSSESGKIHKYIKDTFGIATEIVVDSIKNMNVARYHRVINAIKDLDLSKKETILTPEYKEFVIYTYKRFIMRTGDLLQENTPFLMEYNDYLTQLSRKTRIKNKAR